MPQLTLKHCTIADVQADETNASQRVVKINVNEEDFFEMLDHVNPKNIIKYLDMRKIEHRDALNIVVRPFTPKEGLKYTELRKVNRKKLQRAMDMVKSYNEQKQK